MTEMLSGIGVALLGVLGVWLTARAKRAGDRDSRDISWFEKLTSRLDKLQEQLDDVRSRLTASERREGAWFRHVMDWRARHPDRSQWPAVPPELRDELD